MRSPFARLALTHVLSSAADVLFTVALASSFFFSVDPSEGRSKVLLGLLFTVAPFALVGPLIGPLVDRVPGGHRAVIVGSMALRAVVAGFMAVAIGDGGWAVFPEAFAMLVLGKTYQVARSAIVPSIVRNGGDLVEANSKLQLSSGLAAAGAAIPAGVLYLIGPAAVLVGCSVALIGGCVVSVRLPSGRVAAVVASQPVGPDRAGAVGDRPVSDRPAGADPGVRRGGAHPARYRFGVTWSMNLVRASVGVVTLLMAFELRGGGADLSGVEWSARHTVDALTIFPGITLRDLNEPPRWYFGVVGAVSVAGGLFGAFVAPRLRRRWSEERLVSAAGGLVAAAGLIGLLVSGLIGYVALAGLVALGAAIGKQGFDATVQREVPDQDRGRMFAVFESRFQVMWVLGALIPAVVSVPVPFGAAVVATSGAAAVVASLRRPSPGSPAPRPRPRGGRAVRRTPGPSGPATTRGRPPR